MRRLTPVLALVAVLSLPSAVARAAEPGTPGSTFLVSAVPGGLDPLATPVNDSDLERSGVSADGRYVAFSSDSDSLSPDDDDAVEQVFVRDLVTGAVTLASRAAGAAGAPAHVTCRGATISDNGRRVAFECYGALDPADTNGVSDVYVRDLDAQTTTLVSRAAGLGAVGDAYSYDAAISGDGQYVAFESNAKNFSGVDPDGATDIFRRRLGSGDGMALITVPQGAGVPQRSYGAAISDNGDVVAYTSGSTGLWLQTGVNDTNNNSDVYARIVSVDESVLVSTANADAAALTQGGANSASVSGDGLYVAYDTSANNTNTADVDSASDVFRRRLDTAAVALISRPTGVAGTSDGNSYSPSLDQTGARVAFTSSATNLGDGDADARYDAHVRDVGAATTALATRAPGAAGAKSTADSSIPAMSDDASTIAFPIDGDGGLLPGLGSDARRVYARRGTDTLLVSAAPGAALASAGGDSRVAGQGAISADGRLVAFTSVADGLSGEDDDRVAQAFVRDTATRTTVLVSRASGEHGAAASADAENVVLSADGRRAAFVTRAALDPADVNDRDDVYVRDLTTATTTLASVGEGGVLGNGNATEPVLDADGSRVAFATGASNLGDGDVTPMLDVHVRDLAAGHTILVSATPGGAAANGESGAASISADGGHVAFESYASNLGDGDADTTYDVHVRDLAAGTTVLASRADGAGGAKAGGAGSRSPSLSGDGTRVAFDSDAQDLDPAVPDPGGSRDVFVRDLVAGTTVLADRADGAAGGKASGGQDPVLSADGRVVLFHTYDPTFAPTLISDEPYATFARDLAAGRTRLATAPDGDAPLGNQYLGAAAVSADGGCVAFVAAGHGLVPSVNTDNSEIYVHVLGGRCGLPPVGETSGDTPAAPVPPLGPPAVRPDRTAPRITGLKTTNKRFRVAKGATAVSAAVKAASKPRAPAGTTFRFTLSEAATTRMAIARELPGRRKGKSCVKATKKLAHAKRCTRAVAAGTLTRRLRAGAAKVTFTGRVGRKALARGTYVATLTATDAAGNRSTSARVRFVVVAA
ncbi:MAG TPA: hypothetical protein VK501_15035 [Baekduia sp.]|uniref:TolB family protein n=1 Tax=Baekduia sp. TaxID=2600305 RepID=UPI002BA026E4|nr:hypothetical protein [Baekduia sp.]HMJ35223.1 hypothetical protein [Baekduia sp.]